jgi:catechol 2,3-dioxygenase-like lactoylglutathione lyase family enzyme
MDSNEERKAAMPKGDLSHVDLTITDPEAAFAFYDAVLKFLGFVGGKADDETAGGWMNPKTGFNIALQIARPGSAGTHDRYSPGLHHLAFDADSRKDVDGLHALLVEMGATILDPPGEYYEGGYYAVFFADPDGLKLECVHLPRKG